MSTRQHGVLPLGTRGLARRGPCGICGEVKKLTKTHVPPQGALNAGEASRLVTDPQGKLALGRKKRGGAYDYLLCEPCNKAAGRWDEEYCLWALALFSELQKSVIDDPEFARTQADHVALEFVGKPGAFVRSVMAGFCALDGQVCRDHPDLVPAILEGRQTAMPDAIRFKMGANLDPHRSVSGSGRGVLAKTPMRGRTLLSRRGVTVVGHLEEDLTLAVISFAPFSHILVHTKDAGLYPHEDHSAWLHDDPMESRTVTLFLPIVTTEANRRVPFSADCFRSRRIGE